MQSLRRGDLPARARRSRSRPTRTATRCCAAVEAALRAAYSFEARDFGQPVTIDEVYAVDPGRAGVVAADIRLLYRSDTGALAAAAVSRACIAALPAVRATAAYAAELLTLDPAPLDLGVMS